MHRRRGAPRRGRGRGGRRSTEDGPGARCVPARRRQRPIATSSAQRTARRPTGTSWLAVDDAFIGNAPNGRGRRRRRHNGGTEVASRAGAAPTRGRCSSPARAGSALRRVVRPLFPDARRAEESARPAAGMSILRPSDGATLGTIAPTEAIPDLLRVDERCDVYVAEDSGHLVAFGALPRLRSSRRARTRDSRVTGVAPQGI